MAETKYLNGIFATRKEGKFGEEISIGLTDEGLKNLEELTKKGDFRNFTLRPQKKDNNKFSATPAYSGKGGDDNGGIPF